jgi:ubiquinone/menaquinone biosynthesis C-methylase UbiE
VKEMDNPKKVVAQGYNGITRNYLELIGSMGLAVRDKYLKIIIDNLPGGAKILELGCGAGKPMTRRLVADHFELVGVDISQEQLALAARAVPEANFVLADMSGFNFKDAIFDAVVAFYSITHVPRDEHFHLLTNIFRMLKPGGLMVATMGTGDLPDTVESDWLGMPMFFSHFDGDTNVSLVNTAGFEVISAVDKEEKEHNRTVCFRWIVARKPAGNRAV